MIAESAEDVRRLALGVLQSRLRDGNQLMDEFGTVLAGDENILHSVAVAQAPANTVKNRYGNVLPYDHNRVRLRPCSVRSSQAPSTANGHSTTSTSSSSRSAGGRSAGTAPHSLDYINASHVVHDDPQYGFSLEYIACQGPLATTVADFWRMCWTERVGAVVMLTNTTERGVTKCSPYFPAPAGTRLPLQGGPAARQQQPQQQGAGSQCACVEPPCASCVEEVVAVSSRSLLGGDLTETRLMLLTSPGNPQAQNQPQDLNGPPADGRQVVHIHYNAWPDHGTPADADAIRTMCDLLGPVRANGLGVVVHCSAGIGRTGTFCTIDILRHRLAVLAQRAEQRPGSVQLNAVTAALDLPELVHSLRRQRGGMVQTLEQYAFCYQAVYEELLAALGIGGGGGRMAGPGGGRRGNGGVPHGHPGRK